MAFRQSIAHLFAFSLKGRKLKSKPRPTPEPCGPAAASIAAGQAGLYLRGLMEAKAGERNLEDIADTVPGGDHQQIHHFVSNSPWDDAKVLAWAGTEADGLLGGLPQSHLIIDESA